MNSILVKIQKSKNLNDEQMAELVGTDVDNYRLWKKGREPRAYNFRMISERTGIPVRDMMSEFDSEIDYRVSEEDIDSFKYLNDVINERVFIVIGYNMRRLRYEHGESLSAVADAVGLNYVRLDNIEKGKPNANLRRVPMSFCKELAVFYEMSVTDLCNELLRPIGNTYGFLGNPFCDEDYYEGLTRLVETIFGTSVNLYEINYAEVNNLLNDFPEKVRNILVSKYVKNKSDSEIGKEIGLSRTRINQIEQKALRKLRHPSRSKKILFVSYDKYKSLKDENLDLQIQVRHLEKMLENLNIELTEPEISEEMLSETPIEKAEFSVRTFNCMKRGGYNTIQDIADSNIEELQKVRNLGEKSLNEVVSYMKEKYNIVIS